ncbi:hypothetical protein QLQ15_08280 [Lysobacter sp. LF1]|uniref:Transmembrane protein n=1 Tax=Lysobacter stagni TaxID=3045172 RepID=A0ABT6XG91_9GAMM|nr:hypothetical protein [Lysobacter sp. LF1]MDI9238910.1 hypothetical protein [Lysobacter sp. LF1]
MENPYQSPNASVVTRERGNDLLDDVVGGQKQAIWAMLLYVAAGVLRIGLAPMAMLALLCLLMSWMGIYRMGRGLGYPLWLRIVLIVLMLVPLVGLLVLVSLSARATSRLRKAGYSVGLMGARNY